MMGFGGALLISIFFIYVAIEIAVFVSSKPVQGKIVFSESDCYPATTPKGQLTVCVKERK